MACVVQSCNSHSGRQSNNTLKLSFHKFPKDENLTAKWIRRIGRHNWIPTRHSRICSRHFDLESFVSSKGEKRPHLKFDAVPKRIKPHTVNLYRTTTETQQEQDEIILPSIKLEPQLDIQYEEAANEFCGPDYTNGTMIKLEPLSDTHESSIERLCGPDYTNSTMIKSDPLSDTESTAERLCGPDYTNSTMIKSDPLSDTESTAERLCGPDYTNSTMIKSDPLSDAESTAERLCGPDYTNSTMIKSEPLSDTHESTAERICRSDHTYALLEQPPDQNGNEVKRRRGPDYKNSMIQHSDVPMPCKCNTIYEVRLMKKKIRSLERQVERVKMVAKRRLVKINTLTKRLSRLRDSQLKMMTPSEPISLSCCGYETANRNALYLCKFYFITEHPAITYLDHNHLKYGNITSSRVGRRNPMYYVDIHFENKLYLDNNYTIDFYFYQFLSNEYKRSFVEMHFKLCNLVNKDLFFGSALRQGKLRRPCPYPPDDYHLYNMTIPSDVIPHAFPFVKGRIYANMTYKDVTTVVTGYIDMELKETRRRKSNK